MILINEDVQRLLDGSHMIRRKRVYCNISAMSEQRYPDPLI
jgi:hypothetical protein